MKEQRIWMTTALVAAVPLVTLLVCAPAAAQDFPRKQPIKFVVPYNAGGGTDVLARITAEFLQRRLGQTVIVENKPGASSAIGANQVAKSPADGYTLLFVAGGDLSAVPAVRKNLPYRSEDFTYLVRGFVSEPLLIASTKLPISTLPEFVVYMKANPGKVTLGSPGIGHVVHLHMAMLESAAGVKALVVPYTGIAPIYTAMFEGTVDISLSTPGFPDNLKVLGSAGSRRSPWYPNAPTLEEAGIKNASWDNWFGIVGPPNLPKPVADRLISEIVAVLKTPEAIARYEGAKLPPDPSPLTGEAFRKRVLEELANWKTVVAHENIVVD